MKTEAFNNLIDLMAKEEKEEMYSKGKEYTEGREDRLSNFKEDAKISGITSFQNWHTHFLKQIHAINNFARTGKVYSKESINSRIKDCRNYLALLRGLIEDHEETVKLETVSED